jgi:Ca-activated chloride channel family protein
MNLVFSNPKFLLLLFIIPLFVVIYFSSIYFNKKKSISFPNFEAMQRVFGIEILSRNFFSLYINLIILALIIFSAAGAAITYEGTGGYVLAVDNSKSMNTADILPTRIDAAKLSANDFVKKIPSNSEIAVVEFSGKTNVLQEPDVSKSKAVLAIGEISLSDFPGTDLDEVIYTSNFLLEGKDKKNLLIITDGQFNSGDLNKTIDYAKENAIIISAVAVGTVSGGLTDDGSISKVDEFSLQRLAFETSGQYSKVESLSDLDRALSEVLIQSKEDVKLNLVSYMLLVAILLFSFNWVMHNFRFRTIP